MLQRLLPIIVVAVLMLPGPVRAQESETFELSELWIETQSGARHHFTVELAVTQAQQIQGLMFREEMALDHGMLFVFPDRAQRSFWMRNTLLSLDMLFIDTDGRVINIEERAVPLDEGPRYSSDGPAQAVLEINGGVAGLLGIGPGDRVIHEAFGNAEPTAAP